MLVNLEVDLSNKNVNVYGTVVLVVIPIIVTAIPNCTPIVPSKNCMNPLKKNTVFCVSMGTTIKSCGNVIGIVKSKAMKISNSS